VASAGVPGGVEGVVDGVRDYIGPGAGWREALEHVAGQWPVAWWDDLLPVVRDRVPDGGLFFEPWERWGMAAPRRRRPPTRPLRAPAVSVLAAYGDERDLPVLLAEIAALDARPQQFCGYDELVTGLARVGYAGLPELLRRLWPTPHSYERTAYLRAYRTGDRQDLLVEGLWDCEAGVRELAATHVGLSPEVRDRLGYLRDDPMEDPDVRGAAAVRLQG
jgi:hypothetical protein